MSAALLLPEIWADGAQLSWGKARVKEPPSRKVTPEPEVTLAFYRKHTEKLLRRYLYASMLVGRAPSLLGDPIGRGWASSRPIRTFEDAVIFVLDVEKCLRDMSPLDRDLLGKVVLQEYTIAETAQLLRVSSRTILNRTARALDHLTHKLIDAGLLVLPQ